MQQYGQRVAQFVHRLDTDFGVKIHTTGVANEPGHWGGANIAAAAKAMRAELDRLGHQDVGIVGSEHASVDHVAFSHLDALQNDPVAWNALTGVATHSYNMASTPGFYNRIAGTGKEYWMTEAGDNGVEEPGNTWLAAGAASRFLNDMNHGVTHWVWFIGLAQRDPDTDAATKLVRPDNSNPGQLKIHSKYHSFVQLLDAFDYGAEFRHATIGGQDRPWTYGRKPPLYVAAAENPDGTFGIGIANYTNSVASTDPITSWDPAALYQLTITIEELADAGTILFDAYRSGGLLNPETDGAVYLGRYTMTDGLLSISIGPRDVVTLRSVSPIPEPTAAAILLIVGGLCARWRRRK